MRRLNGEADPIGKRAGAATVIGVVGDVRNDGPDRPVDPEFYQVRKATGEGIPGGGDDAWWRRATAIVLSNFGERHAALYGPIFFLVAERTREIGVRMALGATPATVARMVVSDGIRWTALGAAAGIGAAAGLPRLLRSLLYDAKITDLRAFAAAAVLLLAVGTLAAWLPARRAARIDPMTALRYDS